MTNEHKKQEGILGCAGSLKNILSKNEWRKFEKGLIDAKLKIKIVDLQ